ncbi:phosphotransferase enzyme family protein [Histoplasma capsulatum H143]|uniref:Phosphotransferase enzyme family protein n=1 Tax=Ajellomyces capsulatus (strain H143) TaxID=544712 RepID=C6H4F9_AJECH|nr:phosphotransferase enzyme family protein [Histoplasma capsulatum H143]
MTKEQQHDIALGIVGIEKKLFSIPFGSIGSLYFKKGIPLEISTGNEPHEYLHAIGKRELEWTQKFGKPVVKEYHHNALLPGVESPEDYSDLLQKYLTIYLTPSNVFVRPETFEITKIIDWQHTVITPLLLAAGHPKLFENPDSEPPETLEAPKPPEGYDSLDSETKSRVDELLRRRRLFYFYRIFNGAKNKLHLSAFYDPLLLPRQHLVEYADRQWNGNLMTLRGALIRIHEYWSLLPTKVEKCPIDFPEAELKKHFEEEPTWFNATALVNYWRDELGGLSEEGWVRTEKYNHAVKQNETVKSKFFDDADPNEKEKIIQVTFEPNACCNGRYIIWSVHHSYYDSCGDTPAASQIPIPIIFGAQEALNTLHLFSRDGAGYGPGVSRTRVVNNCASVKLPFVIYQCQGCARLSHIYRHFPAPSRSDQPPGPKEINYYGQLAPIAPLLGVGKRTSKSQGMKASLVPPKGWKAQAQHRIIASNLALIEIDWTLRSHKIKKLLTPRLIIGMPIGSLKPYSEPGLVPSLRHALSYSAIPNISAVAGGRIILGPLSFVMPDDKDYYLV